MIQFYEKKQFYEKQRFPIYHSDGDEAGFFFLPIKLRVGRRDTQLAVEAVDYIRKRWPWWDRHGGGHRHIIMQSGERDLPGEPP